MKRALIVAVALAAVVAMPMTSWAQAKPDFSGKWTLDEAKSDPAPARAGGGGGRGGAGGTAASMAIKQTAAELTIDRVMGQGTQTAVYKLDGSESVNAMGQGQAKSKASWNGATLVIATSMTMTTPNGEMTMESKETYSVSAGLLTIETSRNTPNGAQTRKLVYTKGS
jgi:hypothetical protein